MSTTEKAPNREDARNRIAKLEEIRGEVLARLGDTSGPRDGVSRRYYARTLIGIEDALDNAENEYVFAGGTLLDLID